MALAAMRQIGDAFVDNEPGMTVKVLPSLGTSGGLAALASGSIDLALSARPLSDGELAKGLQGFAYARTPIAFVTHPDTGMDAITLVMVADMLLGNLKAWPGGTTIRLIRREASDADWSMLRAVSTELAEAVQVALARPGLITAATDQENADALERLPGSFGMMSLGQILAEARSVQPLKLDSVMPDLARLATGEYRFSRTLFIIARDPRAPAIARFLTFLRGRGSSELLARLGCIPLAGPGA